MLPTWSATDPHRLWRFEQEARAAAALKHPNVVAVFDVGRHGQTPFIVSELLEGQNLRERMSGQPMPVRGAAQIVAQACRGLAAAHAGGVVHRDLKPENVFITRDGQVKILDFGLAKLRPKDTMVDPATATGAGSAAGQVLGTVAYMAPEQVRAEPVDARTDIFAVGAMLYEMLAGAQPFRGRSAIDTLSALLSSEPAPLAEVARNVPADVARIVHRCLEKSPDARFQSAADLAFALESATAGSAAATTTGSVSIGSSAAGADGTAAARSGAGTHGLGRSWTWRVLVGAGLPLLGGLVAVVLLRFGAPSAQALPLLRLSLAPPPGVTWGAVPAVSPEGRRVAFIGVRGAQTQLFIQSLESREASAIPGTSGAMHPFWSSDSTRVGFLASPAGVGASLELRTVGLDGTVSSPLWTGLSRGAAFAPDGSVIVGPGRLALMRVPPGGGPAQPVTSLARDHHEYGQRWPVVLPDGRHVIFFSWASPADYRGARVARLDLAPGSEPSRMLLQGDSSVAFVPGDARGPDLLLFERNGDLFAQRFDAVAATLSGSAFLVERDVGRLNPDAPAQFSASPDVLLVGADVPFSSRLNVITRDGQVLTSISEPGVAWPRISPEGRRVLHGLLNYQTGDMDLWVIDLDRDVGTRVTARPGFSGWPVWAPDGRRVAYRHELYAEARLVVKSLDDSSAEDLVLDDRRGFRPTDWSPDGQWVVAVAPTTPPAPDVIPAIPGGARAGLDLWLVPAEGGEPVALKKTEFTETEARVAPSGRIYAYVSDVSGRNEVYLDDFPADPRNGGRRGRGGPWRVSADGGDFPVWSKGGRELLYFGADDRFHAVDVSDQAGAVPVLGRSVELSLSYGRRFFPPLIGVHYAVAADGERLITMPERGVVTGPMRVIVNWRSLLK